MDRSIWKYELKITDEQTLQIPEFSRMLSVQFQSGTLCLWAEVFTKNKNDPVIIEIFGTGNEVTAIAREFIGTAQKGEFVWHVYRRLDPKTSSDPSPKQIKYLDKYEACRILRINSSGGKLKKLANQGIVKAVVNPDGDYLYNLEDIKALLVPVLDKEKDKSEGKKDEGN